MAYPRIRAGETYRPLSEVLVDPSAVGESLEGKTVRFYMRLAGHDSYRIDGAEARIVNAAERRVAYDWRPGDTDTPALYTYRWAVVYPYGTPEGSEWSNPTREKGLEIVGFETFVDGLPWSTATEAQRYVSSADGAEPIRLQFVLEDASEIVTGLAPPPDPLPADYPRRARRAELRVFEFLWTTGGYRTSTSRGIDVLRRSESYARLADVREIVKSSMGPYASRGGGRVKIKSVRRG